MTQKVFANFIGMSEGSLSGLYSGRTRPTLNIVELIKNKIPAINTDWLMFGKGQMYGSPSDPESDANDGQSSALDFVTSAPAPADDLFSSMSSQGVPPTPKIQPKIDLKYFDKPQRQITEIKIFFDDHTFESFVPKK